MKRKLPICALFLVLLFSTPGFTEPLLKTESFKSQFWFQLSRVALRTDFSPSLTRDLLKEHLPNGPGLVIRSESSAAPDSKEKQFLWRNCSDWQLYNLQNIVNKTDDKIMRVAKTVVLDLIFVKNLRSEKSRPAPTLEFQDTYWLADSTFIPPYLKIPIIIGGSNRGDATCWTYSESELEAFVTTQRTPLDFFLGK